MSRTQDLVLARLRLIALRWQGGMPAIDEVRGHMGGPGGRAAPEAAPLVGLDAGGEGAEVECEEDDWADSAGSGLGIMPDASGGDPSAWLAAGMWVRLTGLLVVIVAIGGAAMFVMSWPREQQVEAAAAPSAHESGDPFADPFPAASPSPSPSVMVHVVGEVRRPGVVLLPAGSRVVDAVKAAGGLRRGGELGGTNLARVLADGERIEVGGPEIASGVSGGQAGASAGPLDLNTATAEQLDALPGVGPVTAAKILAWRSTHKRFSVVDELAEVPGIGPKTLADLRPLVRV